ncbi:glutathione-disulfide reductase [Oceanibacterium hippocampi]|uniref:Glutathione reductase n=1 Tax=Oceanibacterium hippocampi TaxID=745714 RepID=A0A1Y5T8U4_9PROT|nr:glutathione-disulfide reductase [Oceanibacterium hippocampi]SLN56601.1 Glutathione amide reductase [Oceanibacterium hippocampi]
MTYDYDLFVIGGGSGGVRAARVSSAFGARVALAEEYRVGGTCVIRGCVPKKMLVYASHYHEDFEDAAAYGWTVPKASHDWSVLIANKDKEIDRLNGIYKQILERNNVTFHESRATLEDAHTIRLADGRRFTAERILIATGGAPTVPAIPGIEHAITSNEAFHLDEMPERIAIVGGGYIAVEFAGIFNGLGAKTVQFYRGDKLLRGFDEDVRDHLTQEIVKKGVVLHLGANPAKIERGDNGLLVTGEDGSVLETDAIMYATGRAPNTQGLGLEKAGVETRANGAVIVDEYSRTSAENIYAVGDVTDRLALTPVAIHEAMAFADTVYGGRPRVFHHMNVASAVFSQPQVGTVGLGEAEARRRYGEIDVYKSSFRALKHTLTLRDEKSFVKLLVDAQNDRVVGVHVIGDSAAEIIQGIAVAVTCGATKAQFDATVGVHPTLAEELVTLREKVVTPAAKAAE